MVTDSFERMHIWLKHNHETVGLEILIMMTPDVESKVIAITERLYSWLARLIFSQLLMSKFMILLIEWKARSQRIKLSLQVKKLAENEMRL